MAKKGKSSSNAVAMGVPSGTKGRLDIGIEPAENGYIVRICKDDGGKNSSYASKRFVASSHGEAMRIAGMGILGRKSGDKKKGRKAKVFAAKKA